MVYNRICQASFTLPWLKYFFANICFSPVFFSSLSKKSVFAGISSGAAVAAALRIGRRVENAVIATIAYDRGERYLSTGLYD